MQPPCGAAKKWTKPRLSEALVLERAFSEVLKLVKTNGTLTQKRFALVKQGGVDVILEKPFVIKIAN